MKPLFIVSMVAVLSACTNGKREIVINEIFSCEIVDNQKLEKKYTQELKGTVLNLSDGFVKPAGHINAWRYS